MCVEGRGVECGVEWSVVWSRWQMIVAVSRERKREEKRGREGERERA